MEKFSAGFGFSVDTDLSLPRFSDKHCQDRVDLVAQSVEHLTFNQGVMGSSPIEITTIKANFLIIRLLAFFVFGLGMDLGIVYKLGGEVLATKATLALYPAYPHSKHESNQLVPSQILVLFRNVC